MSDHNELKIQQNTFLEIEMSNVFPTSQPVSLRMKRVKLQGDRHQECSRGLLSFL
jgi:hypothetical protein